jgi:hypothetical protein
MVQGAFNLSLLKSSNVSCPNSESTKAIRDLVARDTRIVFMIGLTEKLRTLCEQVSAFFRAHRDR